ncbi:hypothetical protein [Georgenia alba]|uniref:Uncharacterized protein n=1 Tax=Georgenia alba TaxID=2233858 RepID=A0ABW2Q689_9MICO
MAVFDRESLGQTDLVDLSAVGAEHGIPNVADPKLFQFSGGVWVTFNTGWSGGRNDIYIMQLRPHLGRPMRCVYDGRRDVEKNWGFFEGAGGQLCAIYELEPLTVLQFDPPEPDKSSVTATVTSSTPNGSATAMTIGTQPVALQGGLALVAHQRVGHRAFRGYFGRPVYIAPNSEDGSRAVTVGPQLLSHNLRTMLGSRPRRNRHLWFATYFSGLDVHDGVATLSYGVNDAAAKVRQVPATTLWGHGVVPDPGRPAAGPGAGRRGPA